MLLLVVSFTARTTYYQILIYITGTTKRMGTGIYKKTKSSPSTKLNQPIRLYHSDILQINKMTFLRSPFLAK